MPVRVWKNGIPNAEPSKARCAAQECPEKAKVVEEILQKLCSAELEQERDLINPDFVHWKKIKKTKKKKAPVK